MIIDVSPSVESDFDPKDDLVEISRIYQVQFFENPDEEDIRKTKWLLKNFRTFNRLKKSYEDAQKRKWADGLDDFDLTGMGGAVKRLSTNDLISNIPENVMIARETRQANYKIYKFVVEAIIHASNNIPNIHEHKIVELLFVGDKEVKYKDAVKYMRAGYTEALYSIEATTFAEKRRRVIASLTNTLLFNGTLDYVTIDYGRGRNKEGEIGLRQLNNRDV
ncbi:hypothetical protein NYE33_20395 [Paenibacillus sp. FSL R10-2199]|uniref:hypothetical protein n=1 Tax=Paenibacillus sp. FSL R10-2199 TaxID=2975348 RepID=UPI0030F8EDB9